jgi:hypothetical protein
MANHDKPEFWVDNMISVTQHSPCVGCRQGFIKAGNGFGVAWSGRKQVQK